MLPAAQAVQNAGRGEPIRNMAHGGLELTQCVASFAAQPPVDFADVITAPRQQLLQFVTLLAGEHALVPRPRLKKWLSAPQSVREMADRERVSLGWIVFHDHTEILQHQ